MTNVGRGSNIAFTSEQLYIKELSKEFDTQHAFCLIHLGHPCRKRVFTTNEWKTMICDFLELNNFKLKKHFFVFYLN